MLDAGKVRNESDSFSFPVKFNTMHSAKSEVGKSIGENWGEKRVPK